MKVAHLSLQRYALCRADYVEVKDGKLPKQTYYSTLILPTRECLLFLGRQSFDFSIFRCCDGVCDVGDVMTTSQRHALVTFSSDATQGGDGFQLRFWSVPRGNNHLFKRLNYKRCQSIYERNMYLPVLCSTL